MNQRNLLLWAGIILFSLVLLNMFYQQPGKIDELTYSQFLQKVQDGQVKEVLIQGNKLTGKLNTDAPFTSYSPNVDKLVERLSAKPGVAIKAAPPDEPPWYVIFLTTGAPFLLSAVLMVLALLVIGMDRRNARH